MLDKLKKFQLIFIYALAALVILCFMAIIVALIFHLAPESNVSSLQILLGVFGAMTTQIVNYFYGSSKGSADKTDMIFNSTPIAPIIKQVEQTAGLKQ